MRIGRRRAHFISFTRFECLVGILAGLTGGGGGSLRTPLLILFFGIHSSTAVGSDLLCAATTKAVGTSVHGFRGSVDWRIVGRLMTGSLPLTLITIVLCSAPGIKHHNSQFLNEARIHAARAADQIGVRVFLVVAGRLHFRASASTAWESLVRSAALGSKGPPTHCRVSA
jgi:hypothetical protein